MPVADRDIGLDPLFEVPSDASPVSRAEAARLIRDRLAPNARDKDKAQAEWVAQQLAAMLPEQALFKQVVSGVDLRPLLLDLYNRAGDDAIDDQPDDRDETLRSVGMQSRVRQGWGFEDAGSARAAVTNVFSRHEQTQRELYREYFRSIGTPEEDINAAISKVMRERATEPHVLRRDPAAEILATPQTATGLQNQVAAGADPDEIDPLAEFLGQSADLFANVGAGQVEPFQLMTPADLQALFRMSTSDLGALQVASDYESALRVAAGQGAVQGRVPEALRVEYSVGNEREYMGQVPAIAHPAGSIEAIEQQRRLENASARAKGVRSYTVHEAANLLWGMDRRELARVQNMLKRAGYFEMSDGAKSDGPVHVGDPTDEGTQQAWRRAVSDSIRSKIPIVDLLRRRAQSQREAEQRELEEAAAQAVPLSSQARIRVSADQLARDVMGRRMDPSQVGELVEFIHGLEKKRGMQIVSEDPGFVEDVDVDAEIEEFIRRENAVAVGGHEVADQYELFTRLLAGPGRPS